MSHHRQGCCELESESLSGLLLFKWFLLFRLRNHPPEGKRWEQTYQGLWSPELPVLQVSSKSPTNIEQAISPNWQSGHQCNRFPQVAHWTHSFICEVSREWGKYIDTCSSCSAAPASELRNHTDLRTLVMLHKGGVYGIQWKFTCLNLILEGYFLRLNSLPTLRKIFVK